MIFRTERRFRVTYLNSKRRICLLRNRHVAVILQKRLDARSETSIVESPKASTLKNIRGVSLSRRKREFERRLISKGIFYASLARFLRIDAIYFRSRRALVYFIHEPR